MVSILLKHFWYIHDPLNECYESKGERIEGWRKQGRKREREQKYGYIFNPLTSLLFIFSRDSLFGNDSESLFVPSATYSSKKRPRCFLNSPLTNKIGGHAKYLFLAVQYI